MIVRLAFYEVLITRVAPSVSLTALRGMYPNAQAIGDQTSRSERPINNQLLLQPSQGKAHKLHLTSGRFC